MSWNLEEAIRYYGNQGAPGDQNAVISLLREIQRENGGRIPAYMVGNVADAYGIRDSFLQAIIRRIPSLRLADTHCLELCAGPNCGKHRDLADFAEELHRKDAKKFTLKYVPCMRMCGKGPNIRWDGKIYHQADKTLLLQLTENL